MPLKTTTNKFEMGRERRVFSAYEGVGRLSNLYNSMMTASTFFGKFALKFFWGFSIEEYFRFLDKILTLIPQDFSGKLLEIPVGTGILTLPTYKNLKESEIFCVDYSTAMLNAAKNFANKISLSNVTFLEGDVGKLSFSDEFFDLILSINGLHAFPDKKSAHAEIYRVLKPNGLFCGSVYITGENWRTDIFVKQFCNRVGVFTPPHENFMTLENLLKKNYRQVDVSKINSFACFKCLK